MCGATPTCRISVQEDRVESEVGSRRSEPKRPGCSSPETTVGGDSAAPNRMRF
ncbi:hypothetical protein BN903_371 [Halorubrum sp. AJ67]|nr:hypothetical protein BN903_371 [Halorubrum sp. AJ67]